MSLSAATTAAPEESSIVTSSLAVRVAEADAVPAPPVECGPLKSMHAVEKPGAKEFRVVQDPHGGTRTVVALMDLNHTEGNVLIPTVKWRQDKAHAALTSAVTPRILGSRSIDLAAVDVEAKEKETIITHFNMQRPLAVEITSPTSVTIYHAPDESKEVTTDLYQLGRARIPAERRGKLRKGPDAVMRMQYRGAIVEGPCWSSTWRPPPVDAYTVPFHTFTNVTQVWVCNGDAVAYDMPDEVRASMDGHTVIVQATLSPEVSAHVGGAKEGLFFITNFIQIFPLGVDEEVTTVWGGDECSSDVFAPVVFTTQNVMTAHHGPRPVAKWTKVFTKLQKVLDEVDEEATSKLYAMRP